MFVLLYLFSIKTHFLHLISDSRCIRYRITPPNMEAAEDSTLFQKVNEQGHLLHQHHDQLARLGTAMEEVLRVLHRRGPPTTGCHSEPAPQTTQPSTQVSDARLSLPEKYATTPSKCCGVLLQCSLYFVYQTGVPTTEGSKVATVISL
ncbi:hypothetical protein J4Q44_G00288840, partial [Coregonus suidteri]